MVLLACQLYAQDYYTVTSETLNIRSSARKSADIIGKLHKNDSVQVLEYGASWSKVSLGIHIVGYVSSSLIKVGAPIESKAAMEGSLAEPSQDSIVQHQKFVAGQAKAAADDDRIMFIGAFFIACFLLIFIRLVVYQLRCKKCKRWFAMKEISKQITNQYQTTRRKWYDQKDAHGNTIGSLEGRIPATTTEYLITRKCKHCGNIGTAAYSNTVRDDRRWFS